MSEEINDCQKAIESLHNCFANFKKSVLVKEAFEGQTVWQGKVHVFSLTDHPTTDKCYAWSSPVDGSKKRKFYAVLHIPPVDSPEKAVRAAIIKDFKDSQ